MPSGMAVTMQLWTRESDTPMPWYHLKTEGCEVAMICPTLQTNV